MSNYIKIFDTVTLTPILESDVLKHKDFVTNNSTEPLIVKIAATHSGLITRNNGFYLPDRMKKGAASFTSHYGKPIQVHHDENADPVGRVLKADYVDISASVKDGFLEKIINSTNHRFGDKFVKDFIDGNLPYIQSVNFIVDSLNRKDSVLDDPDYKGMGYILLTASISDPEAKQKVLDGRYLTGSVGVTTNHAVCSVCKQDWTGDEGKCVLPNTIITLADGSVDEAKNITVGTKVITHSGTIGKITEIHKRHYNGNIVKIDKIGNNDPLYVTDGHPVFRANIKTKYLANKNKTRIIIEHGFLDSEQLLDEDSFVATPVIKKQRYSQIKPDEAAFYGLYASEGSTTNSTCIEFSLHKDEVETFKHYFDRINVDVHTYYIKDSDGVSCRFSSAEWQEKCIDNVGKLAKEKRLSKEIVFAKDESIKAFLGAFIDGDGCVKLDSLRVIMSTASRQMAYQLLQMCRNIGISPSISEILNPGGPTNRDNIGILYNVVIAKSQVGILKEYSVKLKDFNFDVEKPTLHQLLIDDKYFSRFETSNHKYHGDVYNFEVDSSDNAHSYIANDIAVHNCIHRPGRVYDGAKAFMITGDLTYDEYSFVNVPADRHSGIMEIHTNGITDSVTMENSIGRSISVNLLNDSVDIAECTSTISNMSQEELMNSKVKDLLLSLKPKFSLVDEGSLEAIEKSFDNVDVESMDEVDFSNTAEVQFDRLSVDKIFALDADKKLDALKTLRPFMEETGLQTVSTTVYATSDELYKALNDLEWQDYSESEDEALAAYLAEHSEDSKLSGAARKRLPGSSFCGPNKSFPVPDCAHVTAARRLIGRASVSSSTKSKILECVSRKSTAMGCGKSKDAVIPEGIVAPLEEVKTVDNVDDCGCKESQTTIDTLTAQIAELTKQLEVSNTSVATVTGELDAVKKDHAGITKDLDSTRLELKLSHEDLQQMADQLFTAKEDNVKLLVDKVITFKQLSGEVIEDSVKLTDELTSQGETIIKDHLTQVTAKVDMKKITDSINSGLTRNPSGAITDPTGNLVDSTKSYTKESMQVVRDEFLRIQMGGRSAYGRGSEAAKMFIKDMQNKGLIPTNG